MPGLLGLGIASILSSASWSALLNTSTTGTCICILNYTGIFPVLEFARVASKHQSRQMYADRLKKQQDSDIQNFVQFICQDKVQAALGFYLEQLKKKKSK